MSKRNKQLRTLRRKIEKDRLDALGAALELAERASSNADPNAETELEFALTRAEQLDHRLSLLPKIEKIKEPDLYREGGPNSFFADLLGVVSPVPIPGSDPIAAQQRLVRHKVHEEARQRLNGEVATRMAMRYGIQARGLSSIVPGSGAEFVPPVWITDQFASVARACAPLRRLVRTLPLPPHTMELVIPRITVASGVVPESYENINVPETIQVTDELIAPVRTITGQVPVSQALFERGHFDQIALPDLGESYAAALEGQLTNGTGTNGQLLGLLNVPASGGDTPAAITNTYTNSSPTPAAVVEAIAQTASLVADSRDRPPGVCLMRPSRYYWLSGTPDGSGNVNTQRVGTGYKNPKAPDDGPFGPIGGLPTYLDATLPNNLGPSANQDPVVVLRPADVILLEDEPKFEAFVDAAGGAEQLTVFLSYRVCVAAFTSRYPNGIGTLTGTGLVLPAGW